MSEWKKYRITHEFRAPDGLAQDIMESQRATIRNTQREGKLIFRCESKVILVSKHEGKMESIPPKLKEGIESLKTDPGEDFDLMIKNLKDGGKEE